MRPRCPYIPNAEWGRKVVSYLGGDPSIVRDEWFWRDVRDEAPELMGALGDYIGACREGDPKGIAFRMVHAGWPYALYAEAWSR